MELSTYLSLGRGRQAQLARSLGCHSVLVYQWANGLRQIPAERCPAIEQETKGLVTCEEMRPDVAWHVLRAGAENVGFINRLVHGDDAKGQPFDQKGLSDGQFKVTA